MQTNLEATIEDLYALPHEQKAEIVDGEIVQMSPTGAAPNYAAAEIFVSLREYARRMTQGVAVTKIQRSELSCQTGNPSVPMPAITPASGPE